MANLLSRLLPFIVGIVVPLVLLLTNTVWRYGTVLLTMASIVWIGFALVLLTPSAKET